MRSVLDACACDGVHVIGLDWPAPGMGHCVCMYLQKAGCWVLRRLFSLLSSSCCHASSCRFQLA